MGRLTFVHGVMDAGKTHTLLARAYGMEAKGYNILTVKSDKDFDTKQDQIQCQTQTALDTHRPTLQGVLVG